MSVDLKIERNKIHIEYEYLEERKIKTGPGRYDWELKWVWLPRKLDIGLQRVRNLAARADSGEFVPPKMSGDEKLAVSALYALWAEMEVDVDLDLEAIGQQLDGSIGPEDCWPDGLEPSLAWPDLPYSDDSNADDDE